MAFFCTYCGTQLKENARFCTNCGVEIDDSKPEQKSKFISKRQKVIGNDKSKSQNKGLVYFIILTIVVLGVVAFYDSLPSSINPVIENQPVVTASFKYTNLPERMNPIKSEVRDGKIIVSLDHLKEKKFLKFSYSKGSLSVPLLAYISEEGKVITAVSMCEPCNSESFHIRGDQLVCNSCGTTWELGNLNGISGSCQKFPPDPLPSTIVGNEIQINESIVANWQRRI